MATILVDIEVAVSPDKAWDAVRDYGALHTRLVPGFVVATEVLADREAPVRVVTFANGAVLRETIVSVDDARRRLVWAIRGEGVDHHNGAMMVEAVGQGCRVTWTADVLPDALVSAFEPLMRQGMATMKATLEVA